jgi:hypothetical protein
MASDLQTDSRLARRLEQGETLPAEWYASPTVFAIENAKYLPQVLAVRGSRGAGGEGGRFLHRTAGQGSNRRNP